MESIRRGDSANTGISPCGIPSNTGTGTFWLDKTSEAAARCSQLTSFVRPEELVSSQPLTIRSMRGFARLEGWFLLDLHNNGWISVACANPPLGEPPALSFSRDP
ncbi:hypothetical protein V1478_017264 [Vespula squamosa]|uniref:Uncharacterized protein n=1 Tax=Vespula squamosa TaxID=30214 RepID=A0ABD1ZXH3_VESSQ